MRASVRRRALLFAAAFLMLGASAFCVQAAEPQTGRFGTQTEDLAFPSVARVVSGFVITVIIAAGVALALRRGWRLFPTRAAPPTNIRPLSRASLSRTLTVHLVEIDGIRMVLAEGRGTVGITVLRPGESRDSNI